jgi:hypothetical protein
VDNDDITFSEIIEESHLTPMDTRFDIFFSHSTLDKKEIAGLATYFQDLGLNIYVDSIKDPHLNPDRVTRDTAQIMRTRMNNSETLLFAFSKNSQRSVWMPWELGYFDGMGKKIAIMPIERTPYYQKKYKGQEYLNLYDYIEQGEKGLDLDGLLVISQRTSILPLRTWVRQASNS